jgi:flagellar protein FliO/FliZ
MRFAIILVTAVICTSVWAEAPTSDKDSDEAIVAAAEKLVQDSGKTPEVPTVTAAAAAQPAEQTAVKDAALMDGKKESEIPLFNKSEKVAKSESSLMWRLLASVAFVALVGAVLIFAGRRWGRQKNKGGEKARIEILHQFHMGPKKSLALIRVAGEAMLIGCTDHNINIIKSLTLIDDELEGAMNKDFNNFLEDDFSIEDVRRVLSARA